MKVLMVLLLWLLGVANAVEMGVRVSVRQNRPVRCNATDLGIKCSTCSTALVCSNGAQIGRFVCPLFCDPTTNTCSNVKPLSCNTESLDFKCSEEGFFPDPNNCQNYYFCNAAKTAELWVCPANFVYDAMNGNCRRGALCRTLKCTVENTRTSPFLVHAGNPNFYAFCNVTTMTAILFKCPKNQQFSSGCKFICRTEGYHAGSTKRQAYFCARVGTTWVQTIYNCPPRYEYNKVFKCEPESKPEPVVPREEFN